MVLLLLRGVHVRSLLPAGGVFVRVEQRPGDCLKLMSRRGGEDWDLVVEGVRCLCVVKVSYSGTDNFVCCFTVVN